jgi:hypothetical protein
MRGRREPNEGSGEVLRTALFALVIATLLVSSVAVVSAARTMDFGPKVGDILVFRPGARVPADWEFTAETSAKPGDACALQPVAMAVDGGSLVVEQRIETPRSFRVHWAGGRTSESATDCGSNAELIVPGEDLQLLSNAVGGAGVEHRTFPGL